MAGSRRLSKACARHGWILQAGDGWFVGLVFLVLTALGWQLSGTGSASSPVRCLQGWTGFIPTGAGKRWQDTAPGGVLLRGAAAVALSGVLVLGKMRVC